MLPSLVPLVLIAALGFERRWVADDAFIDFRVVNNLVGGYGPVFNVGERVEAFTNPLWVALLAACRLVVGQVEIGAVVLGLSLTLGGITFAALGSSRLAGRTQADSDGVRHMLLPAGSLVFAAVPASWDFATSGLETGLILGWLGAAFWALVAVTHRPSTHLRIWCVGALVGLGPLIRPDLALFSAAMLLVLVSGSVHRQLERQDAVTIAGTVASSLALPGLYEVFRMGYFAAIVPNTAIAKEAGAAYWSQGVIYLLDFVGAYALAIPAIVLGAWWALIALTLGRRRNWIDLAVWAAPVAGAVADTLYVTRVGGDFMHARMLLPALFGILLPVSVVPVPLRGSIVRSLAPALPMICFVVGWAIVASTTLRVPYVGRVGPFGIADERGYYVAESGSRNPVTAADYGGAEWTRDADTVKRLTAASPRTVVLDGLDDYDLPRGWSEQATEARTVSQLPMNPAISRDVVAVSPRQNVGVSGAILGPQIWVVDRYGLADPIASRLIVADRGRPGHEKTLSDAWVIARFTVASPGRFVGTDVDAARGALACGQAAALLSAVQQPLTVGRFVSNVFHAWEFTQLRIPVDPVQARATLCRTR